MFDMHNCLWYSKGNTFILAILILLKYAYIRPLQSIENIHDSIYNACKLIQNQNV